MSTRCYIGRYSIDENGTSMVRYIYCHHDGYPDYLGELLKAHYTDDEALGRLFELGDLSALGSEPREWAAEGLPQEHKGRYYSHCVAFHEHQGGRIEPLADVVNEAARSDIEYMYVFGGSKWFCWDTCSWPRPGVRGLDLYREGYPLL